MDVTEGRRARASIMALSAPFGDENEKCLIMQLMIYGMIDYMLIIYWLSNNIQFIMCYVLCIMYVHNTPISTNRVMNTWFIDYLDEDMIVYPETFNFPLGNSEGF